MNTTGGIETVLAEHDWRWAIRDSASGDGVRIACLACECEWFADRAETDDVWAAQRAHVAAEIAAHLLSDAVVERAALAIQRHSMPPHPSPLARAALAAAVGGDEQ
jgi:hypothetical protein